MRIALLVLLLGTLGPLRGQFPGTFVLQNSIISVQLNGNAAPGFNYPCITQLSVNGEVIVPPIAVGALFQMDIRSAMGDNYNPTQSGACYGQPSQLAAWMYNWTQYTSIPSGVLMGVVPRTFLDSTGQCTNGDSTPYYFNWGIQLGSRTDFPEQAMIIVQMFQKTSPNAQDILYIGCELPTIYYDCSFAVHAYYMENNDFVFVPLPTWTSSGHVKAVGYGNMFCNADGSLCAGTYTGFPVSVEAYNFGEQGGCPFNMVSTQDGAISDMNVHSRTVVFVVGDIATVQTALMQTANVVGSYWGDI